MTPVHRHQVAWLSREGWQHVLDRHWDAEARDCLRHWAGQRLPLVVTRQPEDGNHIALGLCAPQRWQRRRIALQVARADVLYFDEFPRLEQLITQLPVTARVPARRLAAALQASGTTARVYGSYGWRYLTGLNHLRDGSDLDLWVGVDDAEQADTVATALNDFAAPTRLDGELVFAGDAAAAWREWLAWREGRVRALLVKRLHGASMVASSELFDGAEVAA